MARLWMCLSLLFAAAILLSRASAGLTIDCGPNNTVEATAGEDLTVRCSADFSQFKKECNVEQYQWSANTDENSICSDKIEKRKMKRDMENNKENQTNQTYTCGWDESGREFHLSIPRINIVAEEIYEILARTNCGVVSATVTVKVKVPDKSTSEGSTSKTGDLTLYLFPIMVALGVVGILVFLVTTQRGRTIIDYVRKKTTSRHLSNTSTDPCTEAASEPLNV